MSNAIKCKKYREKQKLLNLDDYKDKEKQRNKLKYKKLKNEPIEEELIDESVSITEDKRIDNEDDKKPKYLSDLNIAKLDGCGFIIYKPLDNRTQPLNKSKLQPQTVNLYFNCLKKVYKNYKQEEMNEKF